MKIENFMGYQIKEKDISNLKEVCSKENLVDLYHNQICNVYQNLVLNSYNKETFIKLSLLVTRLLRNYDDVRVFELGLKMAYYLIDIGEKELTNNRDNAIEYYLSNIYEILSWIICDFFKVRPYNHKAERFNVEKDDSLALKYLERAILLSPNDPFLRMALGLYYYFYDNFNKAFDYLISAREFNNGKLEYFQLNDLEFEINMFTKIGFEFDMNLKNNLLMCPDKVFLCFEAAYKLSKKDKNLDKDLVISCYYNMAYVYLHGIGVKENIRKGRLYLNELDKVLKKYNEDILTIDDPDRIIAEYFEKDETT